MPYLIIAIVILIVLVSIYSKYSKQPTQLGKRGEYAVSRIIGRTIENEQYVINNLMLDDNGKTMQIDHIVINSRGVFVIETKNYSGDIYGQESQREWTQVLANGRVKNKLYNPLKQNATHVYGIRKLLGELPVYSFVVFVQNNTQYINAKNVIPLSALQANLNFGRDKLSIGEMRDAYEKLLLHKSDVSLGEHVYNIKKQQRNVDKGICPRCGGNLVLRNGKYGDFWGCSNYPKCRFIKKMDTIS